MIPLYISVHKVVRELDGKLFFAVKAATEGYPVILGRKAKILNMLDVLPEGVFFDTRMNASRLSIKKKNILKIKNFGHSIWCFDEEMTSIDNPELYQKKQISSEVIGIIDSALAWSEFHAELINGVNNAGKVHLTGHPRYDVYRLKIKEIYSGQAKKYNAKFGKYVLIPSSFGPLALGDEGRLEKQIKMNVEKGFFTDDEDISEHRDNVLYRKKSASCFIEAVKYLAENNPGIIFIVRPHFADPAGYWEKVFDRKYKNIHVIHKGPIAPWIYGASAVIHHHCSTAIEAYLMGCPVISYVPIKDERFSRHLPKLVSHEVDNQIDLLKELHNILSGKRRMLNDSMEDNLKKYLEVDGKLATERILELINKRFGKPENNNEGLRLSFLKKHAPVHSLKIFANNFLKRYRSARYGVEPPITRSLVLKKLDGFVKHIGVGKDIRLTQIKSEVFLLDSKNR